MKTPAESHVRTALRRVKTGRRVVLAQHEVIERLRAHHISTEKAEAVLDWLNELQRDFEHNYRTLIGDENMRLKATGYRDPTER